MQRRPLDLSVIVRTSGRSPVFLRRALRSIAAQTLPPRRVIVVNDGTDTGPAQAEVNQTTIAECDVKHLARDPKIRSAPNRSAALNRGIAAAETEWIGFLDDDDTWSPSFLERVAPVLEAGNNRPDFGGVVTQTDAIHEELKGEIFSEKQSVPFNPGLQALDLASLAVENLFTLNSLVIKRAVFGAVGNYREDLPVLEDWEFNVRAVSRFHFEVIPERLVRYHFRPGGNTATYELKRTAAIIRNEWLRADLAAGRLGLGQLALAGESVGLRRNLGRLERWQVRMRRWFGGGRT